jgi:energy-coupling factor transporter ATPase
MPSSSGVTSMPIIEVRGIHHTYMAGTPLAQEALRGVTLSIERGEIVAIIGSTGSGKSTLLQHMNGLLLAQRGEVWVLDQRVGDRNTDLREVRQRVGLVLQRPEDQVFEQYVGDDVAYGPRLGGLSRPELRERVRWAMEQVGLDFEAYRDRLTPSLSGGERRRVALAGVLAMQPLVLLLDEPTAGLDPAAHLELLHRLLELRAQGITIVLATHDMDDVARLAGRIYVLHEGQVVLSGSRREVFARRGELERIGLDVPFAARLTDALRRRGMQLCDALTLDEAEQAILGALHERATA